MSARKWFRAKEYGWGWYPATWEGWVVLLSYLVAIIFLYSKMDFVYRPTHDMLVFFIPGVAVLTGILILICYKTGETPEWRWGKKKKNHDI